MKIVYDREDDVLTVEILPDRLIDHAEQSGPPILTLKSAWCSWKSLMPACSLGQLSKPISKGRPRW